VGRHGQRDPVGQWGGRGPAKDASGALRRAREVRVPGSGSQDAAIDNDPPAEQLPDQFHDLFVRDRHAGCQVDAEAVGAPVEGERAAQRDIVDEDPIAADTRGERQPPA